jgi:DNA-binding protein HU-beta
MSKQALSESVHASLPELSKAAADRAVDAVLDGIAERLQAGEVVELRGFGRFSTAKRAARKARNPLNGEPVDVPAKTVAKFRPSKQLNASLG